MKHVMVSGLLLGLAGCMLQTPPPRDTPPAVPLVEAQPAQDPAPPSPVTPPAEAQLLPADAPEIRDALAQYELTGKAPVIRQDSAGFVRYPFGLSQPVVACEPLHVCDIALEPGEQVLGTPVCGDGGKDGRWVIDGFVSGPAGQRTPHVTVKPTDWNLATNLTIGTDRRVYYIALVAKKNLYLRRIAFYYPEDAVAKFNQLRQEQAVRKPEVAVSLPQVQLDQLDERYEIAGATSWKPTWVANDGTHTFLRMPVDGMRGGSPALFVQRASGQHALVNYRVKGGYYVVDSVFERAVLTLGSGRDKQTVTITRTRR